MLTYADAVAPLPDNILSLSVSQRAWNGVCVDLNEWHCSGMVAHQFRNETETRLVALLEEVGSPCEPRLRENLSCPIGYTPRHMDFAPAGMEMWGYGADVRFVKDATLTFDLASWARGWPPNSTPMRPPRRDCAFPMIASGAWSSCSPMR